MSSLLVFTFVRIGFDAEFRQTWLDQQDRLPKERAKSYGGRLLNPGSVGHAEVKNINTQSWNQPLGFRSFPGIGEGGGRDGGNQIAVYTRHRRHCPEQVGLTKKPAKFAFSGFWALWVTQVVIESLWPIRFSPPAFFQIDLLAIFQPPRKTHRRPEWRKCHTITHKEVGRYTLPNQPPTTHSYGFSRIS